MEQQLNSKPVDSSGGLASTVNSPVLTGGNNKLPDGGGQFTQNTETGPSRYVNNGLASMFGPRGQNPQIMMSPTGQQQYGVNAFRNNMWQPNMGANYQVIGGVGNII